MVVSSIFVQISAYHDYELYKTIIDCIAKSSGENTLSFGIHVCYKDIDDITYIQMPNIQYIKSKAPDGLGVGYGRYLANEFYNGENYYLQIDAHTRFSQDWDINLIEDHKKYTEQGCNPVLTAYPSGYHYENSRIIYDKNPTIVFADFQKKEESTKTDFLHQTSMTNKEGNIFTRAVSAGHIFASGNISSIKPNNKMFNWGEEFITAIRLFTHGYDLMLPTKQNLYHLYYGDTPENQRRLSGKDYPIETDIIFNNSQKEIQRILSGKIIGDQELGIKRTLEDFWYYADINF
jgi:Glycosyltransferase (GlcNAc)